MRGPGQGAFQAGVIAALASFGLFGWLFSQAEWDASLKSLVIPFAAMVLFPSFVAGLCAAFVWRLGQVGRRGWLLTPMAGMVAGAAGYLTPFILWGLSSGGVPEGEKYLLPSDFLVASAAYGAVVGILLFTGQRLFQKLWGPSVPPAAPAPPARR